MPYFLSQVDPARLLHALTTRTLNLRGEQIVKQLDAEAAAESRDALAKTLYATLFDWLVAAINRKIPSYSALQNPKACVYDSVLTHQRFEGLQPVLSWP